MASFYDFIIGSMVHTLKCHFQGYPCSKKIVKVQDLFRGLHANFAWFQTWGAEKCLIPYLLDTFWLVFLSVSIRVYISTANKIDRRGWEKEKRKERSEERPKIDWRVDPSLPKNIKGNWSHFLLRIEFWIFFESKHLLKITKITKKSFIFF